MHLQSRSVKDERMSPHAPHIMRGAKGKAGVSGGYCDPSVVMVNGPKPPKLSKAAKRARRRKLLAAG